MTIFIILAAAAISVGNAPQDYFVPGVLSDTKVARIRKEGADTLKDIRNRLDAIKAAIPERLAGSEGTFQRDRVEKRLETAYRLHDFASAQLAKKDDSRLGFVFLAIGDFKQYLKYFADEFKWWQSYPGNPKVEPVVLNVRDYGAKGDGVTSDSEAFSKAANAIRELNGKPSILKVPSGKYLLDQAEPLGVHVSFYGVTNCIVEGESPETTDFIFGQHEASGVSFVEACNSTLSKVNMYYKENPFSQGTALEKSMNKTDPWVIVKHDPDTMRPNDPRFLKTGEKVCSQFDAVTGKQIVLANLFFTGNTEDLGDGKYKIHLLADGPIKAGYADIKLGCKFIMPDRSNRLQSVCARNGYLVNFDSVWIRNARAGAFTVAGGYMITGWKCRVFPRGKHLAMSTNADSFFNSRGTHLAYCDFHHMNDDGVNCLSGGKMAARLIDDRRTLLHRITGGSRRKGDLVQFLRPGTGECIAIMKIASIGKTTWNGDSNWHTTTFTEPVPETVRTLESLGMRELTGEEMYNITHGRAKNDNLPDYFYCPEAYGPCFVCHDNSFGSLRNIGIQVQCPNALIENNKVYNISSGACVSCLMQWIEGTAPYNVAFIGNDISDVNCGFRSSYGAPGTKPLKTTPFCGLEFVGNRFSSINYDPLCLLNASDCTIKDNLFVNCKRNKIVLRYCKDILIEGNKFDNKRLSQDNLDMSDVTGITLRK